MALRIGPEAGMMPQMNAASNPAVLPEEEDPMMDMPAEMPEMPAAPPMDGNAVEWMQEALDICKQANCPEELAYAIEQALVHLIGPSAIEATESLEPTDDIPVDEEVETV